jgi:hypothetical protein
VSDDDLWTLEEKTFRYSISRFHLFSSKLRVARLNRHFSQLSTNLDDVTVPIDRLRDVDVFMIRPHPVDAELPPVTWMRDSVRFVPAQYKRSYSDLTGTFEDYLKTFSPKSRKNKQREARQFAEFAGEPEPWREYRTPDEIVEFHRLGREVAGKAWQEGLIGGGLQDDPARVADMRRLAAAGRASGHVLFHGPKPVAYIYLVYENDVVMFEYTGFDPGYRDHSPGKVLLFKVLESLFKAGKYKTFDYGEGEGMHKDAFSTHQVQCADLYYFPHRPKALASVAGQAGLLYLRRGMRSAIARTGLAESVKRVLGVKKV